MPTEDRSTPPLRATLNYLSAMTERPRFHPGDRARTNLRFEPHTVELHDARTDPIGTGLDRTGFTIVPHRSNVANFRDSAEVETIYRGEIEQMMLAVTGAAKVVVARHGLARLADRAPEFGTAGTTHPLRMIHADYTAGSGPNFARGMLTPDEAETWRGRRMAGYSVWRGVSPPPQDVPLAVLDWQSVDPADQAAGDVVVGAPGGREITWEGGFLRPNPAHRWCWFPAMHRGEALVFKMHDSDPNRAQRVFHSAFDHPATDAVPRESIDIRVAAFFDE